MRDVEKKRGSKEPIHDSIKSRLGYPVDQADHEVLQDWRERLRRVCKPCWELKYCPYGPLVEQSPLLPVERGVSVEHNQYIKQILNTGIVGQRSELDDERRTLYEEWLADEEIITSQAAYEIERERRESRIAASENPSEAFEEMFRGDLPPIHEYRVDFDMNTEVDLRSLDSKRNSLLKKKIRERKQERKRCFAVTFRMTS